MTTIIYSSQQIALSIEERAKLFAEGNESLHKSILKILKSDDFKINPIGYLNKMEKVVVKKNNDSTTNAAFRFLIAQKEYKIERTHSLK